MLEKIILIVKQEWNKLPSTNVGAEKIKLLSLQHKRLKGCNNIISVIPKVRNPLHFCVPAFRRRGHYVLQMSVRPSRNFLSQISRLVQMGIIWNCVCCLHMMRCTLQVVFKAIGYLLPVLGPTYKAEATVSHGHISFIKFKPLNHKWITHMELVLFPFLTHLPQGPCELLPSLRLRRRSS